MRQEPVAVRMQLQEARYEAERCLGAVLSLRTVMASSTEVLRMACA